MRLLKSKSSQLAYSLLEVLLVIAILAIIASLGVASWQKQQGQTKIDKAVKEIQLLLQASQSHLLVENDFFIPEQGANIWGERLSFKYTPYLPFEKIDLSGKILNPWGFPYQFRVRKDDEGKTLAFGIRTLVPNQAIAQRLSMRLPFAYESTSPAAVAAYIPVPAQERSVSQPAIIVRAFGEGVRPNNQVTVNCPEGWNAEILPLISKLKPMLTDSPKELYAIVTAGFEQTSVTDETTNSTTFTINQVFTGYGPRAPNKVVTMDVPLPFKYIAYCRKKP